MLGGWSRRGWERGTEWERGRGGIKSKEDSAPFSHNL